MILTLGALALAGLVGVTLLEVVVRRTPVMGGLLVAAMVLLVTINTDVLVPLSPFNIFLGDVLFLLVAGAGLLRLMRLSSLDRTQLLVLALFAGVVYSAARGTGVFALDTALNEARQPLRYYAAAFYFSTLVPTRSVVSSLGRMWLWGAAALSGLVLLRWGALAGGFATGWLASPGDLVRVINSDEALFLLQAGVIAVGVMVVRSARGRIPLALGGLLLLIIGLQHRTVWVALVVVLGVLGLRNVQLGRRVAIATGLIALVVATLLMTVFADDLGGAGGELTSSATNQATFEWRLEGWEQLVIVEGPNTVHDVLVGKPFGSGWQRRVFGIEIDVAPHNWYLETYLRVGLIGLGVFLALLLQLGRRALWLGRDRRVEVEVVLALLLTQAVYYLTYSPSAVQGIITGVCIAVLRCGGLVDDDAIEISPVRTSRG